MERVLKPMFWGKQPASTFAAGVDITVEMLSLYSLGKAYTSKTIWEMVSKVQWPVKKAMSSLIQKIDFVTLDRTGAMAQYASGRTSQ